MDITTRLLKVLSSSTGRELAIEDVKNKDLINALELSSVDALEVLIRIEGEFNILIDDEDLSIELVSSFDSLTQYVQNQLTDCA